jgi:type I restriction enzyme S subunit
VSAEQLITEHIDLWTSSIKVKNTQGRGSRKKRELYGIKKLRELILELAVRGKLVLQDPDDEPAIEALTRITESKARLLKDKKIKKQKPLSVLTDEEKPFELPLGWHWTQLGQITEIAPRNEAADDLEVGFVPMPLITTSYKGDHDQEYKPWGEIKKGYTHFQDGDIGLAKITPCFENSKAAVFRDLKNGYGAGTTELHIARPLPGTVEPLFILLYLKAPMFLDKGKSRMTGSAGQKRIPYDFFAGNPMPFPPVAEQHRIVAKVDELMALCEQLEQQTESSLDAHNLLVDTLLSTLTDAHDANELSDNWARLADHFDTLITTDYAVEQLKQTILQLAVQGKLVPQDPKDEPASELLKRIAKEKEQLIKDKKIKKQKPLSKVATDEKSYEMPTGWCWVRFAQIANEIATGPFGSMIHKSDYVNNGIPLINPSHMIDSKIIEDEGISVSRPKAEELSSYRLYENDIVMARRGEMGRCALVTDREAGWLCGTGSFTLRFNIALSRRYILLLFKTRWVRKFLGSESVGATMTNLNHSILNKMPLMIPPAEEQNRIVEEVDRLVSLCCQLKAGLDAKQAAQLLLTDSIVEKLID